MRILLLCRHRIEKVANKKKNWRRYFRNMVQQSFLAFALDPIDRLFDDLQDIIQVVQPRGTCE